MHIHETVILWKNLAPYLIGLAKFEKNRKRYWKTVQDTCERVCGEKASNPFYKFPQFVEYLYKYRNILHPTTTEHCTRLIGITKFQIDSSFITTKLPFLINNPVLYLESIIKWKESNHSIWKTIINDYSIGLALINLYLNIFTQNASRANSAELIRNMTLYIATDIIKASVKTNSFDEICDEFLNFAANVLSANQNLQLSYSLLRCINSILPLLNKKSENYRDNLTNLLISTVKTDAFKLTAHMLFPLKRYINTLTVFRKIGTITTLEEVEFVDTWMIGQSSLTAASLLLEAAYRGPILNAACIHVLSKLLLQYQYKRMKEFIINFIRRSFVFFIKSDFATKNPLKVASMCYNFVEMSKSALYLKPVLAACVGALTQTNTCPKYILMFIKPGNPNRTMIATIRKIIAKRRSKFRVTKKSMYRTIRKSNIPRKIIRKKPAKKHIVM